MSTTLGALAAASRGPVDNDAIARSIAEDCAGRAADRAAEPPKLNLARLPMLNNELRSLTDQLTYRRDCVTRLAPAVHDRRAEVRELKAAQKRLTDQGDIVQVHYPLGQVNKKLAHVETILKDDEVRLTQSENLVEHWTKMIDAWHVEHDDELKALQELDAAIEAAIPTQRSVSTRGGLLQL
jgi:hypothetical protein